MHIDQKHVQTKYNNIDEIWSKDDSWHFYTFKKISNFIKIVFESFHIRKDFILLNAGSAGNEYNINCNKHIHIDLAEQKINTKDHFLVASIENIPLEEDSVDCILCVGSVLNYTDAFQSIKEFRRTLKNKGYLIIEFENSYSFEYLFTRNFRKKADIITTFYKNEEEKIWIYSYKFIEDILALNNFRILKKSNFHFISSLIYRISKNESFSSKFTFLDSLCKYIPILKNYSSNTILFCQKAS